jgi:hypothetical protein
MKTYNIYFWHGIDDKLAKKLSKFCDAEPSCSSLFFTYTGTLDNFTEKYNDKFIVMPSGTNLNNDTICVTQYSNFGQR